MNFKKKYAISFILVMGILSACQKKDIANNGATVNGLAKKQKTTASAVGDVVGKVTVGYQGWFAAIGDGSPINVWWHWCDPNNQAPSPTNIGVKSWPDVRE